MSWMRQDAEQAKRAGSPAADVAATAISGETYVQGISQEPMIVALCLRQRLRCIQIGFPEAPERTPLSRSRLT